MRLLKRLSIDETERIRRIQLRLGLNILWSPPEEPGSNATLYQEAWGGHAAGKTLFCRILRYLLGEPNFSTAEVVESIQQKFLEFGLAAVQ